MRTVAICLAGALVLASCGDSVPVKESEPTPAPSDGVLEELKEVREPSPDPAAGADNALAQGQWFAKTERGVPMAMFGPPQSEALFSIRCEDGELVFARGVSAGAGTVTMALTAGGQTRTIAATAQQDPLPRVTASLLANDPFAESLASVTQPIAVGIGDDPKIRIPAHDHLRDVAANCED